MTEFNSSFTTISTTEGSKYIFELQEGDLILDGRSLRRVKEVRKRKLPPTKEGIQIVNLYYAVERETDVYEDALHYVTNTSKVMTQRGFVEIFALREGDSVELKKKERARVTKIEIVPREECNDSLYSIETYRGTFFFADQVMVMNY